MMFDRFGPRKMSLVGLSIMTVTTFSFCFFTENSTALYLCSIFCIRSFGMSMVNMPINTWGINALDNRYVAHGNAVNNTARQMAGSIGTAIMITIMTIVMTGTITMGEVHATVEGMHAAFMFSTILALIALVHDDEAALARRQSAKAEL